MASLLDFAFLWLVVNLMSIKLNSTRYQVVLEFDEFSALQARKKFVCKKVAGKMGAVSSWCKV